MEEREKWEAGDKRNKTDVSDKVVRERRYWSDTWMLDNATLIRERLI